MDAEDILFNAIETFAKSISKEIFGLVYYSPDKESIAMNCISNVKQYVERHGGLVIYGWTFGHRESLCSPSLHILDSSSLAKRNLDWKQKKFITSTI